MLATTLIRFCGLGFFPEIRREGSLSPVNSQKITLLLQSPAVKFITNPEFFTVLHANYVSNYDLLSHTTDFLVPVLCLRPSGRMHSESELCDLRLSCPFWAPDQIGDTTARLLQGGSCWDSASHERFHGTEKLINVILPEQAGTLGFSLIDSVVSSCRQWSCCLLIQHPEKSYSDTTKSQGNRGKKNQLLQFAFPKRRQA